MNINFCYAILCDKTATNSRLFLANENISFPYIFNCQLFGCSHCCVIFFRVKPRYRRSRSRDRDRDLLDRDRHRRSHSRDRKRSVSL